MTCNSWKSREVGDQVGAEPVGEIGLLRIAAKILERQYDHHGPSGRRRRDRGVDRRRRRRRGGREQISAARQGAQPCRRLVAQGAADVSDALGDAVLGHEGAGPDGLHNGVAPDQLPGVFDQMPQQGEGFGPQRTLRPVGQKHAAAQVHGEAAEPVEGCLVLLDHRAPVHFRFNFRRVSPGHRDMKHPPGV